MKKYPEVVKVHVSQQNINEGKCLDPNKCMYKLAVRKALDIPHGYIKVDSTGISITRRPDWREKAFLPRKAVENMLLFDQNKEAVKPHTITLRFFKTTRVTKHTRSRMDQVNKNRRENNQPSKYRKYNLHKRVQGLAIDVERLEAMSK